MMTDADETPDIGGWSRAVSLPRTRPAYGTGVI